MFHERPIEVDILSFEGLFPSIYSLIVLRYTLMKSSAKTVLNGLVAQTIRRSRSILARQGTPQPRFDEWAGDPREREMSLAFKNPRPRNEKSFDGDVDQRPVLRSGHEFEAS